MPTGRGSGKDAPTSMPRRSRAERTPLGHPPARMHLPRGMGGPQARPGHDPDHLSGAETFQPAVSDSGPSGRPEFPPLALGLPTPGEVNQDDARPPAIVE